MHRDRSARKPEGKPSHPRSSLQELRGNATDGSHAARASESVQSAIIAIQTMAREHSACVRKLVSTIGARNNAG